MLVTYVFFLCYNNYVIIFLCYAKNNVPPRLIRCFFNESPLGLKHRGNQDAMMMKVVLP